MGLTGSVSALPSASPAQVDNDRALEPFVLVDQTGQRFDLAQLRGKTVLLNFVFTTCSTACPVVSVELAKLQEALPTPYRDRVHLLSVSVDPLNDTPERLASFTKALGVDRHNWAWLTGDAEQIDRFNQRFQAFDPRKKGSVEPADHITSLILLDAFGRPTLRYKGPDFDGARVLRELMALDDLHGPSARTSRDVFAQRRAAINP